VPQYNSWRQVAGYFDGDGTIYFSDTTNRPYKLSISLVFVDQSFDQIKNVKDFLNSHGIRTSNILKRSDSDAYELAVSEFKSVKKALRKMVQFLCKKEIEARAAIDYYEGRTTGNELAAVFDAEVEAGRRERRPRKIVIDVPYNHAEGDEIMRRIRKMKFRNAFSRFRARVTVDDFVEIREEYFDHGKLLTDLIEAFPRYSRETLRRILGRDRGYVGVKGIGRVDTTDTSLRDPRRAEK
jgi:hypothetical protein